MVNEISTEDFTKLYSLFKKDMHGPNSYELHNIESLSQEFWQCLGPVDIHIDQIGKNVEFINSKSRVKLRQIFEADCCAEVDLELEDNAPSYYFNSEVVSVSHGENVISSELPNGDFIDSTEHSIHCGDGKVIHFKNNCVNNGYYNSFSHCELVVS